MNSEQKRVYNLIPCLYNRERLFQSSNVIETVTSWLVDLPKKFGKQSSLSNFYHWMERIAYQIIETNTIELLLRASSLVYPTTDGFEFKSM